MKKPVILFVCGDAGGAAAIAPVAFKVANTDKYEIRILASEFAHPSFKEFNLKTEPLKGVPNQNFISNFLLTMRPALLVTGTSWGIEPEKPFVAEAKKQKIPALSVLDYWSNYRHRFQDANGEFVYLPDKIAIMDEQAYQEMIAEGFPADRLVITGAPQLESLAQAKSSISERRVAELQAMANKRDKLVLFASQPVSTFKFDGKTPVYSEDDVIRKLIKALEVVADRRKKQITLAIKPHPRESIDRFKSISSHKIATHLITEGSGREWSLASDLVTGMRTILLVEACYLGRIAMSVQPGLKGDDPVPTNRTGMSVAVYDDADLGYMVEKFLYDEAAQIKQKDLLSTLTPPMGAANRIADLVFYLAQNDFSGGIA